MSQPFQLLVKPVSGNCNLACSYCFYRHVPKTLNPDHETHRMTGDVLENLIREYLGHGFSPAVMCWQGGEPTLAGLEFFRKVVELQRKYACPGQVIGNALQTNGVLIDDHWSRFLAQHRFLVGLSIDGPAHIHDSQRVHADGSGSWREVMRAARRFVRDGVAFNILTVVSRANEEHGKEVFQWLAGQGFSHLQFIPCVDMDAGTGAVTHCSVTPEGFGGFLCQVFDEWLRMGPGRVSVRDFDSLLRFQVDGCHDICTYGRRCGSYLLVEHNGDMYPCDFFASQEWKLGRLGDVPLAKFFDADKMREFMKAKCTPFDECRECRWVKSCHGGCQKDRLVFGSIDSHPTYLCRSYQMFFEHSKSQFVRMAESIRRQRVNAPH